LVQLIWKNLLIWNPWPLLLLVFNFPPFSEREREREREEREGERERKREREDNIRLVF
jgi:hypothetical protein